MTQPFQSARRSPAPDRRPKRRQGWQHGVSALVLLVVATLGLGCEGFDLDPHRVQAEIARQMPGTRFHLEEDLHLGRVKLGFVKGLVRLAMDPGEDPEVRALLRAIERVHITTYSLSGGSADHAARHRLSAPEYLVQRLDRAGWMVTVDSRDDESRTMVLSRFEGEDLRGLYVIQLEEDELALVHVEGRGITDAIAQSIQEDPTGLVGGP